MLGPPRSSGRRQTGVTASRDLGAAGSGAIRICVYDCPLVAQGVRSLLAEEAAVRVIGCRTGVPDETVDLALVDLAGSTEPAVQLVARVTAHPRIAAVVSLSWACGPEAVAEARAAGAVGLVSKRSSGPRLAAALLGLGAMSRSGAARGAASPSPRGAVRVGEPSGPADEPGPLGELSAREHQVLVLLVQARRTAEIADALYLSTNTVKTYTRTLFHKIGVGSRTEAALWGIDHGVADRRHLGVAASA